MIVTFYILFLSDHDDDDDDDDDDILWVLQEPSDLELHRIHIEASNLFLGIHLL